MKIRFGTRGSKLALWQTRHVIELMRKVCPELEAEEVIIKTLGDQVTGVPLFKVGGQGLFIKELEEALLRDQVDLAVHSLKDMPHQLGEGLVLGAVSEPEDPRDALLSRSGAGLTDLPTGSRIGTSSLRRRAQLSVWRPDFLYTDLRGNLDTRLRKLEEGEMEAIILAAAGLHRLGLRERVTEYLSVEQMIPAAGQGLLGIECRAADSGRWEKALGAISHPVGRLRSQAERAFLARLRGGCQTPLAVHAWITGQTMEVRAFLAGPESGKPLTSRQAGPITEAASLGMAAAEDLLAQGGDRFLSPH